MLQPKLLVKLLNLLNENKIDYMITGSIVSSIQGEPRSTHDIDIVVNITYSAISLLTKTFVSPDYYVSDAAIKEAIEQKSMFNVLDTLEGDRLISGCLLMSRLTNHDLEENTKKKYLVYQ